MAKLDYAAAAFREYSRLATRKLSHSSLLLLL
jgi:hypothetical protein